MADDNRKPNPHDKPQQEQQPPPSNNNGSRRSTENPETQNNDSLASRIQNSASNLARNAFYTPGVPGLSADLAQSLVGGGKPSSSSSSSSGLSSAALSSSSAANLQNETRLASSSSGQADRLFGPSESFRSSSSTQQGGFELPPLSHEEFQRQTYHGDDLNISSTSSISASHDILGKGKGKAPARSTHDDNDFATASTARTSSTVVPDGAAVVSLLSDHSFDPAFLSSNDELNETIDAELEPPAPLTPEEIQIIESFRRHLGGPADGIVNATGSQTHRLTSFSLIPDIENFLQNTPAGTETDATRLRDEVLTGLPGAADWIAVEEKYHDEVWGYLRPALEAAATEMEAHKGSENTEDGPAVRRLKMILRHMQA